MAAALLAHRARGKVGVRSAGSPPAESLNPAAVQVLAELGIDVAARTPRKLDDWMVRLRPRGARCLSPVPDPPGVVGESIPSLPARPVDAGGA